MLKRWLESKLTHSLAIGSLILLAFSGVLVDHGAHRVSQELSGETGGATGASLPARLLGRIEWAWYDFKFAIREPDQARGVLIGRIDDASLERYGRWPWNRSVFDAVIRWLYELGAEVVAFDAVFSEPEFQSRYLDEYLQYKGVGRPESLQEKLKLADADRSLLARELPGIGDQVFASAILSHPKTVLGYIWQGRSTCSLYDPTSPKALENMEKPLSRDEATQSGLLHVESLVDSLSVLESRGISVEGFPPFEGNRNSRLYTGDCPTVNRSALSANAKYQGFFSAASESDGLFRRIPLVFGFNSGFVPKAHRDFLPASWFEKATLFPSLAVEAVSAFWESPRRRVELKKGPNGQMIARSLVIERAVGEPVKVPLLADGTVPLNFYGSQHHQPSPIGEFSLASIEADLRNVEFQKRYGLNADRPLSGQIVVLGPTALGVYDLRPNPTQGDAPGVVLHATMIARLLELARHPNAAHVAVRFADTPVNLVILWSLGGLLTLVLLSVHSVGAILSTLGMILTFLGVDFWLFSHEAYALDATIVSVALAAVFLGIFAYKYFTEEQDRAFVKGAFEKYVSPDLVGQILADPRKLNLGGQKRVLSVLFSDIRGFTTMSEKLGAAELAQFLNEYLSPMTDLIQENKGTIDKYMGDAIMAIFGAPIPYEDHAARAVDAALAMLKRLNDLNAAWGARGLPSIDIGIGINTGEMSVGNMGSSRIFSYTVMGDAVNLGSRIEGINKEYGTQLIVSEFTRAQLNDEYACRELDRVRVKGKKLPVTIFEVRGKGSLPEHRAQARRFEEALSLYYAQRFQDAQRLFDELAVQDKTSVIYSERCAAWIQDPPSQDWDGSWTMKTK